MVQNTKERLVFNFGIRFWVKIKNAKIKDVNAKIKNVAIKSKK